MVLQVGDEQGALFTETEIDSWYAPLGLSGYAGVGKDTIARSLLEYGFTRVAFGDKIRELLYAVDPWLSSHEVNLVGLVDNVGWDEAKQCPEVRTLLQNLARAREVIDPDVWLTAAKVLDTCRRGRVVITDVRFPNEAHHIKTLGGVVLRVERDGYGPALDHDSDKALDNWAFDGFLVNATGDLPNDRLQPTILAQTLAEGPYGLRTSGRPWA